MPIHAVFCSLGQAGGTGLEYFIMMNGLNLRALLRFALLASLAGCNREPQITSYDAPKEEDRMEAPILANAAPPAAPQDVETISGFDTPKSWKLDPTPRTMREMTFNVGEGEKSASIIVMRFPAPTFSNDVLGNINRWRGQVGAEPVKTVADQKTAKIKIGTEDGTAYDLPGKAPNRQVIAMLPRGEDIWYFKFIGHTETINLEWENFEHFLASVKFGKSTANPADPHAGLNVAPDGKLPAGHPTVGPGEVRSAAPVEYKAADSWKLDPQPRPMREATYNVGEGEKAATVIVSRLPAVSYTNDVLGNINRWRNQVGMEPIKDKAEQKTERVALGGLDGTLYDLAGPKSRQIIALVTRGEDIWYFKITGNSETVEKEKAAFGQFLASIKFAPGK